MSSDPKAIERFLKRRVVGLPGDCWPWPGYKGPHGYGTLTVRPRTHRVHRLAWEAENGEIPAGLSVLHHCDNPACCNPAHLFLGDDATNMQDKVAKGRWRNGQQHLNETDSAEACRMRAAGLTYDAIGKALSVSKSAAWGLVNRH